MDFLAVIKMCSFLNKVLFKAELQRAFYGEKLRLKYQIATRELKQKKTSL